MGLCDCPLRSTHTKDGTNTKGQEESRGRLASLETRGRRRRDGLTAVWSAVAAGAATASLKIIFAMKDVYTHLIDGSFVACPEPSRTSLSRRFLEKENTRENAGFSAKHPLVVNRGVKYEHLSSVPTIWSTITAIDAPKINFCSEGCIYTHDGKRMHNPVLSPFRSAADVWDRRGKAK